MRTTHFQGIFYLSLLTCLVYQDPAQAQGTTTRFAWPEGNKAALSLTFDDARPSQVQTGAVLLDKHDVKATFYVVPDNMKPVIEAWKKAVESGHEIGNHTQNHPCTGNFDWIRDHALEDYTWAQMRHELIASNDQIKEMLGVTAVSYAYTCGQKFIGRGQNARSYIPLIAEMFDSGRGFLDETANAPEYLDLAQLTGIESDGKDFDEIKPFLDEAQQSGDWVVLAGHEMAEDGNQTTRLSMLEELIAYAQNPANGIWLTTVAEITAYIEAYNQQSPQRALKEALTFHASFDYGYDADYYHGNEALYTAPKRDELENVEKGMRSEDVQLVFDQGRFGGALEFKKKGPAVLYYKSEDNISYNNESWSGTVSLWLQLDPEKDLEPGYCDPIQITDVAYNDAALWVDFTNKNPRAFRMGIFGDKEVWKPDPDGPDDNPVFNSRLVVATDRPFTRKHWTHVVISYSNLGAEDARADFYINGKLQGTQDDIPEPFTWDLEKSKIFIGLNYVGLIDDVAIFDRGLSTKEIGILYGLEGGVSSLY